jgi:hypothetical protein
MFQVGFTLYMIFRCLEDFIYLLLETKDFVCLLLENILSKSATVLLKLHFSEPAVCVVVVV